LKIEKTWRVHQWRRRPRVSTHVRFDAVDFSPVTNGRQARPGRRKSGCGKKSVTVARIMGPCCRNNSARRSRGSGSVSNGFDPFLDVARQKTLLRGPSGQPSGPRMILTQGKGPMDLAQPEFTSATKIIEKPILRHRGRLPELRAGGGGRARDRNCAARSTFPSPSGAPHRTNIPQALGGECAPGAS